MDDINYKFGKNNFTYKSVRICDEKDIGPKLYKTGVLYLCPPADGLSMKGTTMIFPHENIEFFVFPANKENKTIEFINKITIHRYQMDPIIDYNSHGGNPIRYVPVLKNRYQLSTNQCHNVNVHYQYSTMQDTNSFLQLGNWQ